MEVEENDRWALDRLRNEQSALAQLREFLEGVEKKQNLRLMLETAAWVLGAVVAVLIFIVGLASFLA